MVRRRICDSEASVYHRATTPPEAMEPLRVAIIGGGISGLTTYLQLRKQFSSQDPARTPQLAITIFESYDLPAQNFERSDAASPSAPAIGGGYGLAANGMHSFRCLDPDIHQHILKNSFPTPRFQMRTRKGWTLGAIGTVIEYPQGPEACCMVTREVVLEALYAKVPREVIEIKEAVQVVDEETEARVVFAGGEERVFDLVVAADGIWSKTRRKVFGEGGEPEYRCDVPHGISAHCLTNFAEACRPSAVSSKRSIWTAHRRRHPSPTRRVRPS